MDTSGAIATLHSFSGGDGANSFEGVILGSDGSFYGQTHSGGASNRGTVFRIDAAGVLTTLHSFSGGDGSYPHSGLVEGIDGSFYGRTLWGGANNFGTVFRVDTSGTLTTLHSFAAGEVRTDGGYPSAGLVQGSDGSFYGTTKGGTYNFFVGTTEADTDKGTVFRVDTSGALISLHSFTGSDGAYPVAPLVQGSDGKFYGTTAQEGPGGKGTVFQIDADGSLTTLHGFGGPDGASPKAGLIQGSDGSFYGTTKS